MKGNSFARFVHKFEFLDTVVQWQRGSTFVLSCALEPKIRNFKKFLHNTMGHLHDYLLVAANHELSPLVHHTWSTTNFAWIKPSVSKETLLLSFHGVHEMR